MSTDYPYATSLIELEPTEGGWEATQEDVGVVGEGSDPGEAVADYGHRISETFYKEQGER